MKTRAISVEEIRRKALLTALMVSVAVILPQICHLLGGQLGYGSRLGEMLLPMHLPVMLAGMLWGPWVGVSCGLISPVVSFALTGMPGAALLPFMTVELAVYGLSAGLLNKRNPLAPRSTASKSEPRTELVSPPSVMAMNISLSQTFSSAVWRRPNCW